MEIKRRLSSMQWKITRSFLVASLISVILFTLLQLIVWAFITIYGAENSWLGQLLGIDKGFEPFVLRLLIIDILVAIAALLGGAVLGFYNGRKIKKSLQSLSWAAEKLTSGELHYRIAVDGDDEIAELADQFNHMAMRIEDQVQSLQRLVKENAELHQQASKLAVNEERQRLARELHDSISQQLFAIMMTMAACARIIDKDVDKAKKQFAIIEDIAAQAQAEMRALLLHLRPVQLEGKQISEALEELLSELKAKHPVEYVWDIDELDDLPTGFEEHIFRIAQEALSNALRHSHASRIELSLKVHKSTIVLRVSDNGIGFSIQDDRSSSSMGLTNIAERTREMGGVWELISAKGKGATLEVRVPLLMKGENDNEFDSDDHRR